MVKRNAETFVEELDDYKRNNNLLLSDSPDWDPVKQIVFDSTKNVPNNQLEEAYTNLSFGSDKRHEEWHLTELILEGRIKSRISESLEGKENPKFKYDLVESETLAHLYELMKSKIALKKIFMYLSPKYSQGVPKEYIRAAEQIFQCFSEHPLLKNEKDKERALCKLDGEQLASVANGCFQTRYNNYLNRLRSR